MRLDGMDAVKNYVPVSSIGFEQPVIKLDSDVKVRVRPAFTREPVGVGGYLGKRPRMSAGARPYDARALQQEEDMSDKYVRDAIDRANRVLTGSDRKFEITTHNKTKQIMIKVLHAETNETIREIPPEKIVDLVVLLCEMAGILYDEKG